MDRFTTAYIECALWSSVGDGEQSELTDAHTISDLAPETLATMVKDCANFQRQHYALISDDITQAGHDFWLTRNGHGAGFWDGDWPEYGDVLTKFCEAYREVTLYVGDDELIYGA
jgi:hypothetical protein